MRIKFGEHITEYDDVWVRSNDICIGHTFYNTGSDTEEIANQLLTQGYADFTPYMDDEHCRP